MRTTLFTLLLLFAANRVSGETAILRNGEVVRGTCVQQTSDDIVIRLPDGKTRRIQKKDMYRLKFQDLSDQEAAKVRQEEELRQKSLERMQAERAVADAKRKAELDELLAYEARLRKQYDEDVARQIERGIQERNRGGTDALKRSAVLPGWGQYYQGHPVVGGFFFAAFAGAAAYSMSSYSKYSAAKEAYSAHPGNIYLLASLPSSSGAVTFAGYLVEKTALAKANASAREARLGGVLTLAIYGINLFQAYFLNSKAEPPDSSTPKAGLRIEYATIRAVTCATVNNHTSIAYVVPFGANN